MNNSYITIIKEKRTALSRKRIPLNQNGCTANFRIGVPFEQNLQKAGGSYVTCSGIVKKIDEYEHTIIMTDQTVIPIEQISDIKCEEW